MPPAKPRKKQSRASNGKKRPLQESNGERDANIKPVVRPRLESTTTNQVTQIQQQTGSSLELFGSIPKHSRFYYDDGSIVFVTKQTENSPATLFRVSRRQLESVSTKLRAIFEEAFDQPGNGDQEPEVYDGCPVLRLEESADDVEALFEILWNGLFTKAEGRTPQFVAGVLRLSTKWDIPHLRTWSIDYLETKIPTTFKRFTKDPKFRMMVSPSPWIWQYQMLELHHEFNLPRVAAMAWYWLSFVNWQHQQTGFINFWCRPLEITAFAPIENLIIGRERIRDRCMDFLYGDAYLGSLGNSSCTTPIDGKKRCSLLLVLRQLRSNRLELDACFRNPLRWTQTWEPPTDTMCTLCEITLSSKIQNFAEKLFDDLPKLFGVQE